MTTSTTLLAEGHVVPIVQYKAPATQPAGNQGVVLQAQSISNPAVTAQIVVTISSPLGPSTGSAFFK